MVRQTCESAVETTEVIPPNNLKEFDLLKMSICFSGASQQNPNTDSSRLKLAGDIDVRHVFFLNIGSGPGSFRGHSSVLLPCTAECRWSSLLHVRARFRGNGGGCCLGYEATGVETVRQALVCLRGTVDTVSDWCQNGRWYLLGGGLCLYAC